MWGGAVGSQQAVWVTVRQAAARAQVGPKTIYRAVHSRQAPLRAATVGARRELRFLAAWIDEWMIANSTPIDVRR